MDLSNNLKLRILMDTHSLSTEDVCGILDMPLPKGRKTTTTLTRWLRNKTRCPPHIPKLIRYEMKLREIAREAKDEI